MTEYNNKTTESLISQADSWYIDGDYIESIPLYTEALNQLEEEDAISFRAYSHRSGAHYECQKYEQAFQDAKQALKIMVDQQKTSSSTTLQFRPSQVEALHGRLGRAAMQLQHYEEAIQAFTTALQIRNNQKNDIGTNTQDAVANEYDAKMKLCQSKLSDKVQISNAKKQAVEKKIQRPTMPKYQYYQNDSFMTIAILENNVKADDLNVKFSKRHLSIILHKGGVDFTVCHGYLFETVNVDKCKIKIMDEKVLIKLKKIEAHSWHELFGTAKDDDNEEMESAETNIATKKTEDPTIEKTKESTSVGKDVKQQDTNSKVKQVRPYASHRDWNAIERDLKKQEAAEKPQGDEALNKLFKNIYAGASEDTRRAMIKSFQTSGGTCLSTNWDEVSKKDYEKERQAPKGMEWKDYEGRRLPQKDDD